MLANPQSTQLKREKLIAAVTEAMITYAPETGVKLREIRRDLKAIREWRLRDVEGWFYIWDAIGSTASEQQLCADPVLADFYEFARFMHKFDLMHPKSGFA